MQPKAAEQGQVSARQFRAAGWIYLKDTQGAYTLKRQSLLLAVALVAAPAALLAQSATRLMPLDSTSSTEGGVARASTDKPVRVVPTAPFSRFSIGGAVSPFGPGVQISTNLNPHLNLRAVGSGFSYSTTFNTNGFDANAKLNLASAGISADIYPFHAGFRISPGVLFLNNNKLRADAVVASGSSFDLNDQSFYSAYPNSETGATPLNAHASLGLNKNKPTFTITTGWGNTIPGKGGHWSFPFEIGVALIGSPELKMNLTGWGCTDQAQTECTDVTSTTDPIAIEIQDNLTQQIAKWNNDIDPLKTYPILSFGVSYSFNVRSGAH